MSDGPTISVDNAVRHYFDAVEAEPDQIIGFYDNLVVDTKPRLEDCHIHLSALALINYSDWVAKAVHLRDPGRASELDPLAPPANIIVFLGSALLTNAVEWVPHTLGHELLHYANSDMPAETLSEEEQILQKRLRLRHGGIRMAGFMVEAGLWSAASYKLAELLGAPERLWEAGAGGLAVQILSTSLTQARRSKRTMEYEERLYELYQNRHSELRAAVQNDMIDQRILQAKPKTNIKEPLLMRRMSRRALFNKTVDFNHKMLASYMPNQGS
jgi:hypothetical protein